MKSKIVYVDMDNVLVDFKTGIEKLSSEDLELFKGEYDNAPHIFSKMEPMKNAIDSFNLLSNKFDTYILSTAPWNNPTAWHDKLKWVQKYLGESAYKRLILTHNKHLNFGDYLIDDRDNHNGSNLFKGEFIHFGSNKFPDWESVIKYLLV